MRKVLAVFKVFLGTFEKTKEGQGIACNCHHLATKVPFTKGPKRPHMCTITDDWPEAPI